jgi:hypothetical protein
MAAPKLYSKLYVEKEQETNLRARSDKECIEALQKRLNDRIQNSPEDCKKAALILESWINKKKT